jgi:hypothetical protein
MYLTRPDQSYIKGLTKKSVYSNLTYNVYQTALIPESGPERTRGADRSEDAAVK